MTFPVSSGWQNDIVKRPPTTNLAAHLPSLSLVLGGGWAKVEMRPRSLLIREKLVRDGEQTHTHKTEAAVGTIETLLATSLWSNRLCGERVAFDEES